MNSFKHFIFTGLTLFLVHIPSALAQVTSSKTELTKPVGGDILPGGSALQGDIKTSFIFSKLIPFAIKYTIRLAVALSVIALIIGGYQYMTAYGNDEKHTAARKTITWALIGLIISITAYGIVRILTIIQLT